MPNTGVVRKGEHHRGAFIKFDGRRYYSKELNGIVGHKLQVFSYQGNHQVIKAIRPEGEGMFQLRTRSATKRITNDAVDTFLRYLVEKHLTNRQASITSVNLRKPRQ